MSLPKRVPIFSRPVHMNLAHRDQCVDQSNPLLVLIEKYSHQQDQSEQPQAPGEQRGKCKCRWDFAW